MVVGMVAVSRHALLRCKRVKLNARGTLGFDQSSRGDLSFQRSHLMKQQDEYLQNACLDGKDACDKAKEEIREEEAVSSSEKAAHKNHKTHGFSFECRDSTAWAFRCD